ncbi:ABC transporter permease [Micromonospora sp. MW-13]|uniref:ABC transporter permease n=1 Tax=Micromonospora sp. MW-13 TaxID=2094022 RepID=UPI000E442D91|nr:ABC transporter permease [Micromonospora sp. MW-13]
MTAPTSAPESMVAAPRAETAGTGRRRSRRLPIVLKPFVALLYVLVIVAVWAGYQEAADVPRFLLASPGEVGGQLVDLARDGTLWTHLGYTVRNIGLGFAIGAVVGALLGVLVSRSQVVDAMIYPFLVVFQAMPKIALAPMFVLWFGLGLTSQLILIVSLSFFPILVGTVTGLRQVNSGYQDLATTIGMKPVAKLFRIDIPAASPSIFAAARVAVVDAMTGAVVAEWISSSQGLGYLLVEANSSYQVPTLMAAIVVIIAVGVAVYQLVTFVETRALSWRDPVPA